MTDRSQEGESGRTQAGRKTQVCLDGCRIEIIDDGQKGQWWMDQEDTWKGGIFTNDGLT